MNIYGTISQAAFMVCLLPQPWRTYRVKHVKGVSWVMWVYQLMGYAFGFVYGLQIHQLPLLIGSSYGILMSAIFFALYWRYRHV
jgi:uncharacterized protein with PQ loop repeat